MAYQVSRFEDGWGGDHDTNEQAEKVNSLLYMWLNVGDVFLNGEHNGEDINWNIVDKYLGNDEVIKVIADKILELEKGEKK